MSKAMIYAVNTAPQSVQAGGTISFYNIVRKSGTALNLVSGQVMTTEAGFYRVDVNLTISPAAASATTVTVLVNGVAVPGASATFTPGAANVAGSVSIPCVIRTYGCCMASPSTITVQVSGVSSVTNAAIEVEH